MSKLEMNKSRSTKALLKNKNLGIKLDIGCGESKQADFVGMDVRPGPGVDIVHNLERFPWPLPDESVSFAMASHVLEHIRPTMPDAKLVALIDLLKSKKVLSDKEIKAGIGEYDHFGTFMRLMDEIWRVLRVGAKFAFVVPYAGSQGYWQDPTHVNPINEVTLAYFDPADRSGFWHIYRPKPWRIVPNTLSFNVHGFLEVVLEKRAITDTHHVKK